MSFSFNFPDPSLTEEANGGDQPETMATDKTSTVQPLEPWKEWFPVNTSLDSSMRTSEFKFPGNVNIKCLDSTDVEKKLTEGSDMCGVRVASEQHSDLVPNVYEGGLKVWECAIDLTEYLSKIDMKDKDVLELGCGAGLPGIMAMLQGATEVHFQDYNPEVIEHYTIQNVVLNRPKGCTCTCRFYSGDWDNFRQHMEPKGVRYDFILTAETIYKQENYRKLTDIFRDFLKENGIVYIAAKSNYFGVGGGTRDFERFIQSNGLFDIENCHFIETGVPREILKLKWKHKK